MGEVSARRVLYARMCCVCVLYAHTSHTVQATGQTRWGFFSIIIFLVVGAAILTQARALCRVVLCVRSHQRVRRSIRRRARSTRSTSSCTSARRERARKKTNLMVCAICALACGRRNVVYVAAYDASLPVTPVATSMIDVPLEPTLPAVPETASFEPVERSRVVRVYADDVRVVECSRGRHSVRRSAWRARVRARERATSSAHQGSARRGRRRQLHWHQLTRSCTGVE
jgi:hypothetical protein